MKQIWLQMVKEGKGHDWYRISFNYWEAKKIYGRIKNREWFIDANIRIAYGYFLWKHHCQAKAPSVFGNLERNYFIAYCNRLIGGVG